MCVCVELRVELRCSSELLTVCLHTHNHSQSDDTPLNLTHVAHSLTVHCTLHHHQPTDDDDESGDSVSKQLSSDNTSLCVLVDMSRCHSNVSPRPQQRTNTVSILPQVSK